MAMPAHTTLFRRIAPHLSLALVLFLLVALWVGGGASRADVIGQPISRSAAWGVLIAFVLFARRPDFRAVIPVASLLFAAIGIIALHLIPLPPAIWADLPGRNLLLNAATVSAQEQPWRPLSISPGATINALSSMIVPLTVLVLSTRLTISDHWRLLAVLLGLIFASSLIGLLQFSGGRFDHPMINDVPGMVSASFANRNHFALFAAVGCLLTPPWAFHHERPARWRIIVSIALLLLFALIILATGSRTGMVVGVLAIAGGLLSVRRRIRAELQRVPRWVAITVIAVSVGLLVLAVLLSVVLGRAISLDRAFSLTLDQDLRRQALPTVISMIETYFPVGAGAGTFDPAYRISEPVGLLSTAYFNHAHNDFLEVVLDAGLLGLMLITAGLAWWGWTSIKVWRIPGSQALLQRIGSGMLLLVIIASITDYPGRTPMMMAVIIIAAIWLNLPLSHGAPSDSSTAVRKAGRA